MHERFIETRNYIKITEGLEILRRLPLSSERMGLAYGTFGIGKTTSLERVAAKYDDVLLLRAEQVWSKASLLERLCVELGLDTKGHSPKLFIRVKNSLIEDEKMIIIDEVDTLLISTKKDVLEMLRDLHDITRNVIFFIGMEESLAKFKRDGHYHDRIMQKIKIEEIKHDDIEKFCELSEVPIGGDVVNYFASKYPNFRRIGYLIRRLEDYCKMNSIPSVDMKVLKSSGVESGIKG